ncbi:MAG: 2-hydroxychromene-2-carboxylate isomerase [Pseudomonadota bacterium]|nr:2-hydroxychromene-2-carboxylate isomerase [Pseudomonadota bacterium]
MKPAAPIDFLFDFSSPYSYVASEWIEALAGRHGRSVRWRAVLLGVAFQAAELKSPVSYPIKRDYTVYDFARSARFEGVPYTPPQRFPVATQNAARVFWWLAESDPARAAAWAHLGLRAYFTRGDVDLSNVEQLRALATEFGLDADEAQQVWNDPAWKARLKHECEAAIGQGFFGAPYFIVDGEPFWGNDRRVQLERWLEHGPF